MKKYFQRILGIFISIMLLSGTVAMAAVDDSRVETNRLVASLEKCVIEHNGCSEFVEVYYIDSKGEELNITETASYVSDNIDVAEALEGRILANGKGEATITITYEKYETEIYVSVENYVDLDQMCKEAYESLEALDLMNQSKSTTRTAIRNRAYDMINCTWTPTSNVTGWKSGKIFYANTQYTGIPYSQTSNQVNYITFTNALNFSSDFYDTLTINGNDMPMYGNDCSGFLSLCWAISRHTTWTFYTDIRDGNFDKVGSYSATSTTSATYQDLVDSYESLLPGDGLNSAAEGHALVVMTNMTSQDKIYCFEQTPYTCRITVWTYSKLANDDYYPFTFN